MYGVFNDTTMYSFTPGSQEEWRCEGPLPLESMGVVRTLPCGPYLVHVHSDMATPLVYDPVAQGWVGDTHMAQALLGERVGAAYTPAIGSTIVNEYGETTAEVTPVCGSEARECVLSVVMVDRAIAQNGGVSGLE
ncbi:hypothetical protein KIPB_000814 [Kipferlia bialata]|uniref:Uncharacterized protein n=1 Tax=Kipferlia bialata TaxID=797122 RepID=A0A391NZW3_9EUKA|nr:hypothetical protein KIPB_000814 [Kipferlia bialata]|eukprot:g814.t1